MAVRLDQIDEILDVMHEHVEAWEVSRLLEGLTKTKAFTDNVSFQATILRLRTRWYARGQVSTGKPQKKR